MTETNPKDAILTYNELRELNLFLRNNKYIDWGSGAAVITRNHKIDTADMQARLDWLSQLELVRIIYSETDIDGITTWFIEIY